MEGESSDHGICILSEDVIRKTLSVDEAVRSQEDAFKAFHKGEVAVPERLIHTDVNGTVLFKPFIAPRSCFGLKVVSVRPSSGVPAATLLLDSQSGLPTALMSATYLTGLRTAAGSTACLKQLSALWKPLFFLTSSSSSSPRSKDCISRLLIFGAGLQAELHAVCMVKTFPHIAHVLICNRSLQRADKLREALSNRPDFLHVSVAVVRHDDALQLQQAISASQFIVTSTPSETPLFDGKFVSPGTFIAAIGSYTPQMRGRSKIHFQVSAKLLFFFFFKSLMMRRCVVPL